MATATPAPFVRAAVSDRILPNHTGLGALLAREERAWYVFVCTMLEVGSPAGRLIFARMLFQPEP